MFANIRCPTPRWNPSIGLRLLLVGLFVLAMGNARAIASEHPPRVYVVLWFDTEDYLLPASDDAALHLAQFLSGEKIRATFKVVGEKARKIGRAHV